MEGEVGDDGHYHKDNNEKDIRFDHANIITYVR